MSLKKKLYIYIFFFLKIVYLELTEAGTNVRTLDFNIVTQIEGLAYNYSLVIQQIDCREESTQLKGDSLIKQDGKIKSTRSKMEEIIWFDYKFVVFFPC